MFQAMRLSSQELKASPIHQPNHETYMPMMFPGQVSRLQSDIPKQMGFPQQMHSGFSVDRFDLMSGANLGHGLILQSIHSKLGAKQKIKTRLTSL